jgi:cytochrome c peroxidase
MKYTLLTVVVSIVIISCIPDLDVEENPTLELMEVPIGFPSIEHPVGNEFTEARWKLGKELFYDPILSADGKISCSSCHNQQYAFADNNQFSVGTNNLIGNRNSPSLVNLAFHPYFTREGGVPTLEMQILVPIQEHNEFDNNIVLISDTLNTINKYVDLSKEAYDQEVNSFVITRALALFERSLISGQSQYDWEFNYNKTGSMTPKALRGKDLFFSDKTNCSSCHNGFNFTNYSFENNGLRTEYADIGRARLTNKDSDIGLFKVPSLRNIEFTSPYMHDGSFLNLMDVIEHYNAGGKEHINKSSKIKPLNLTDTEKEELLEFLNSLTDYTFLNNTIFSNE